jgi:hypothetical protein
LEIILYKKFSLKTIISINCCKKKYKKIMEDKNIKIYKMPFANVYPLYIQKVENKGHTKAEVDEIIFWLTGYNEKTLQQQIENRNDFETFFAQAPEINENATKITGVICGIRVEEIENKLMQQIRYLDKLIDELAKNKAMDKILRK